MGNQRNDQEAGNRLRYSPNYDLQVPRFSFLYYLKIIFPPEHCVDSHGILRCPLDEAGECVFLLVSWTPLGLPAWLLSWKLLSHITISKGQGSGLLVATYVEHITIPCR